MFSWIFLILTSAPISVEVDILNGDVLAARDVGQTKAFEKAIESTFTEATTVDVRAARLKSPARFIKSYRLLDEKRVGEKLALTYDIELQDLNQGTNIAAAPLPDASTPIEPHEMRFEIVFVQRFPAAELVDQISAQLKLKVNSFRLTRSALILKVTADRPVAQVQQEIQAFVGARGQVNYVNEEIGVPMPTPPLPTPPVTAEPPMAAPAPVAPAAPVEPAPVAPSVPNLLQPNNIVPMTIPAPMVPGAPSPTPPPAPTPIVEAPAPPPVAQPPAPTPEPAKPEWKPVRPKPWTPPIYPQQNHK